MFPDVASPGRPGMLAGLTVMVAMLASGCGETSRVDPNATLHVTGRAVTPIGSPLIHRAIRLGAGVPDDDATLAVLTAGLACTGGRCSGTVFDSTTSATGGYSFTLRRLLVLGSQLRIRMGSARLLAGARARTYLPAGCSCICSTTGQIVLVGGAGASGKHRPHRLGLPHSR
jgi:hypothetical protein